MEYFKKTIEQEKAICEFDSKTSYFAERHFEIDKSVEINEKLLFQICPTLRSLLICKKSISDEDLGKIIQHSFNLELLEVWGHLEITFEGLSALQGVHSKLKHLEIAECPKITDEGMYWIADKFPNLQDLELGPFCYGTTKGFQHIVNKYTSLISLSLDMCDASQGQVRALVERCPQLVVLHIEHSNTLRDEGLEDLFKYLSKKYPHLAIYFH